MRTFALSAIALFVATTAFADKTATTMPRVDDNVVNQTITQAGGFVDLIYVMSEDPDISALQNFCVGGCDVTFRITYHNESNKAGEGVLQAIQVTPVQGEALPEFTLVHQDILMRAEGKSAAEFFRELRKNLRRYPDNLFSSPFSS